MKVLSLLIILTHYPFHLFAQADNDSIHCPLPPFHPTKIVWADIPKTKMVGGKLFHYAEPRYVYGDKFVDGDKPGDWFIYERPKGIFTYYNDSTRAPYKIEFYSDTLLIKTLYVNKINPYTKARYPALANWTFSESEFGIDGTSDSEKPISEIATSAFTAVRVRESDQNYVTIDFEFIGETAGIVKVEHTFILYDNNGTEKGRFENIKNLISDPVFTHRGRYMSYKINYGESNQQKLIIKDVISDTLIFDSDWKYKDYDIGEPNILSKDPNSVSPYTDGDSCYIMLDVKNHKIADNCDVTPLYIDIENRRIYRSCNSTSEWGISKFPQKHYQNIRENIKNGTKF